VKLRPAIVALAILAPALACQLLVGIEDDRFSYEPAPPEAGIDAGIDAAPSDPCLHAVPPGQPPGADLGDDRAFAFAVREVGLSGRTDAGGLVGYDLDNVCTCDGRVGSARGGLPSCQTPSGSVFCDEDAGVDNVLSTISSPVPGQFSLADAYNTATRCGTRGLLFVVNGYNGKKDDPQVVLFPVESGGIRTPHDNGEADPGCPPPNGGAPTYPAKFDETDKWSYPPNALLQSSPPRPPAGQVVRGWVRDFVLVVDGSRPGNAISLPVAFGSAIVTVSTAILTARLVGLDGTKQVIPLGSDGNLSTDATSFRLEDGVVAGRAATKDILSAFRNLVLDVADPRSFICDENNLPTYNLIKQLICSAADTVSVPTADFTDANCDALSIAIQFRAAPAAFGTTYEPPKDGGCDAASEPDICSR